MYVDRGYVGPKSSDSIHVVDAWNPCSMPEVFYEVSNSDHWCRPILTSYVLAHPSYNCWVPCTVSGNTALLASDRNEVVILSVTRKIFLYSWLLQVTTEVINRVQSLLLNYLTALLRSGDFTSVYYQMGELEYIRLTIRVYYHYHF